MWSPTEIHLTSSPVLFFGAVVVSLGVVLAGKPAPERSGGTGQFREVSARYSGQSIFAMSARCG
jgi:hypothetical protein